MGRLRPLFKVIYRPSSLSTMASDISPPVKAKFSGKKPKRAKNDPPSPILSSHNPVLDTILDEVRGLNSFMSTTKEKLQQIEDRWITLEAKVFDVEHRISDLHDVCTKIPMLEQEIQRLKFHTEDLENRN